MLSQKANGMFFSLLLQKMHRFIPNSKVAKLCNITALCYTASDTHGSSACIPGDILWKHVYTLSLDHEEFLLVIIQWSRDSVGIEK